MPRFGLLLVGIMLLAACGGGSSDNQADTISTVSASSAQVPTGTSVATTKPDVTSVVTISATPESVTLDANAITMGLQTAGLPLSDVIVYNETTDPNNLLGRPNGYLSKTAFKDSRCTQDDSDPGGIENGGGIEVFADHAGAKARADYIQSLAKASHLLNEYDYVAGAALLRLSTQLTPTQADEYKTAFEKIVGQDATAEVATTAATPASQPTTVATSAPIAGLPTEDDLKPLMLTLSDMPVGWTTWNDDSGDDSSSPLCGHPGDSGINQVKTSVDFKKSDFGPFFSETLAVFKKGDAEQWMDQFKAKLTCNEDTITGDDGTPTPVELSPLSFPKIGDDTFALRMTADTGILGSYVVDAIYVRVGNKVIGILNLQLGAVDSDLTQSLTQLAVDRVKQ
jgi:hypothetical protein